MGEIAKTPVIVSSGQSYFNDTEDDAMVFTADHTYRDILRYVIAELGDETLFHVQDFLANKDTAL